MGILAFWLAAVAVGALALPITFALFRRFPDGGAGFALPLGLTLAGCGYFLLRCARILNAGQGGALLALLLLGLVGAWFAGRDRRFLATFRRAVPGLLAAVGLFSLLFFAFVTFRSYNAGIQHTEQPMDLMFLNTAVNSPHYPPEDPWFAGERVSYYYFGYVQIGLLTSAANIEPSSGYTYGLAYTFAAAGTAIASLVFALLRWVMGSRGRRWATGAAAFAVMLLVFVGSLSAPFEWAASNGHANPALYEALGLDYRISCTLDARENCYSGPAPPARSNAWYPTEFWNWWPASRVIPGTITEFPVFSLILGDLHPHVVALPLVVLVLALAAAAWRARDAASWRSLRRRPGEALAIAVVLGALAFMNAWDVLTFGFVYVVATFVRNWRRRGFAIGPSLRAALRNSAGYLGPLAVLAAVIYLPWYLDFSSQAGGIRPYVGTGTLPAHAILQFGILLVAGAMALTFAFRGLRGRLADIALGTVMVPAAPIFGWFVVAFARGELNDARIARGDAGWATVAIYGLVVWAFTAAFVALTLRRNVAAIGAGFATVGALLLLGSELFFIVDVFADSIPRQNTVFKLSYQAWVLLSAGGAVAVVLALRAAVRDHSRLGWLAVPAGALAAVGLVYPLIELPNRTNGFDQPQTPTDSLAFLARDQPEEYALVRWMETNVDPGAVVIEASGRQWARAADGTPVTVRDPGIDYNIETGRIGSRTGRATLIGWPGHELQWRGSGVGTEIVRRQDLADRVYLAGDAETALAALREAGATYVVVGQTELNRFPGDLLRSFDGLLDLAWQQGSTRVYRVPVFDPVRTS